MELHCLKVTRTYLRSQKVTRTWSFTVVGNSLMEFHSQKVTRTYRSKFRK